MRLLVCKHVRRVRVLECTHDLSCDQAAVDQHHPTTSDAGCKICHRSFEYVSWAQQDCVTKGNTQEPEQPDDHVDRVLTHRV